MTLESVKAVGEVYAPADLEILEANASLEANPGLVNESAEADGWLVRRERATAWRRPLRESL